MSRIVLVADDSPTIQKRALGILKGQGFEVETVSNGVAAIKRLAVLHPVVVLADVSMPGRDGYEVCEFVKKSPEHSHVPVLLVASDMEPYDAPRGEQVGADGIIKKPFEARDLISIVEKFAEQFEAATIAFPPPPIAPAAKPEPAGEFAAFGQEPDAAPAHAPHVEPDFSAHEEGVAFAEPAGEEAHGFSYEPHPDHTEVQFNTPLADAAIFSESAFEPPSALPGEQPSAVEAPPPPSPFAPSPAPAYPEEAPFFSDGLDATPLEPVFTEEQPAQAPEHSHDSFEPPRTMIFRAPLEIAEPLWKDDTAPSAPAPGSDGPLAFEPQYEAAAPVAPPEIPMEQASESTQDPFAVTATSLDGFSLDDAATGHVHFASEGSEVAHQVAASSTPREGSPFAGPAFPESVPEVVYSEPAAPEPAPEAVHSEATPLEVAPEVVYSEQVPAEATPETVPTEITPPMTVPELDATNAAPPEAPPEAVHTEVAAPDGAPQVRLPEPAAEVAAAPLPALDWDSFYYSIIRKVVVRMSPPVLPSEVIEKIARRLADEIAAEISPQSPPPPTHPE